MKHLIYLTVQLFLITLLTIITQLGGVIWLFSLIILRKITQDFSFIKKWGFISVFFIITYTIISFIIVPPIAKKFGRIKLPYHSSIIDPATLFTIICNRNYVEPQLYRVLINTGEKFQQLHPNLKITYLDACFPFLDGFPLLPHLSHNDGKKIDLAFFYKNTMTEKVVNEKPSNSGYGYYEGPAMNEENKSQECKLKGNIIYDFPQYLTFGIKKNLAFDQNTTAKFIFYLAENPFTHKILLEPHLKKRLGLQQHENKIRFQGCHSVRHDDHLHLEVN